MSAAARRASAVLAPLTLWAAGLAAAFYPALLSGFTRLQIRHGDPRLVNYILEHSWRWAAGAEGHGSFWSPPVYWPAANASALSDVMLGAAPFYWVWRALGIGPGAALELWMMACLSLNFAAAYLFLRAAARASPWPSAAGAFLFGFGSARLANFNSPQLFPLFWGVLALTAVTLALREAGPSGSPSRPEPAPPPDPPPAPTPSPSRTRLWISAAAAAGVLQVWSAFYPAFFLGLILFCALGVGLVQREGRARLAALARDHAPLLALAAVISGAAVWPLARAHLAVAEGTGLRPWREVAWGLPGWASWVYPGSGHLWYGALGEFDSFQFQSAASQHSNGVGFATAALALGGLLLARRPLARTALGTSLALVLLASRWSGDVVPWKLVYELAPGGAAIRYPARLGIYLALPAAVGVAFFLERLRSRGHGLAMGAVAVLVCAEQLHRLDARDEAAYRSAVEEVAGAVDPGADAFFLTTAAEGDFPAERARQVRARQTQLVAMWAALEAGRPTVNGFYGLDPAGWTMWNPNPRSREEAAALELRLAQWLARSGVAPDRIQRLEVPEEWMPWRRER